MASTHAFNVSCDLASYRAPPRLFHGGGRPVLWFFGALLWLLIAPPAHAQQSPMVQCRIGSWVRAVPDFACSALMKGATKLRPDDRARGIYSINDCDKEVARYVDAPFGSPAWQQVNAECNSIFSAMLYDNSQRAHQ